MPRVKAEDRKRAKRPKTSTGCYTCKIRRVKCDEAKPSCQRCVSTGRKCDGYPEAAAKRLSTSPARSVPSVFTSEHEHRAFEFFVQRTQYQLTGAFECEFWNRVLLQAAQEDVAIRHAVIALASLHEEFENSAHGTVTVHDFALDHYSIAIRIHVERLEKCRDSEVESYLASCIVFLVIEILQGHYLSALSLLEKATNLLHEQDQSNGSGSAYPVKSFESMLRRLQLQAAGLLTTEYAALGMPSLPLGPLNDGIPESFDNLTEAKECLELHGYASHLSRRNTQQPYVSGPTRFRSQDDWLTKWTSAYEKTLETLTPSTTQRDQCAADTLRARALIFQIMMGIRNHHPDTSPDELSWDHWWHCFADIIDLAERVCRVGSKKFSFTVDFGIIGPIYDTARVCRHPAIRRKAIQLLREYPCREGLWDSMFAARSAERQMELEDACLDEAGLVPAWARIVTVVPSAFPTGQQRCASVVYTRQKDTSSGAVAFHESIEW